MALNQEETALHEMGNSITFWKIMDGTDCYDALAAKYEQVEYKVEEEGEDWGQDEAGDPVGVTEYPSRPRPTTTRPHFDND